MKLLLTGFEPFGGYQINPSDVISQQLDKKTINNVKIVGKTIPLRYKEISPIITELIEETNPEIIINMGQAPRSSIAFERVAVNLADVSKGAYNCGSIPDEEPLIEGGPVAYFSTLPLKKLVKYLRAKKIPCYVSNSAGTFGCNQIMYYTLNYLDIKSLNDSIIAGFIHLPLLPEQTLNTPQSSSMSLNLMKKAIELVIEFLGKPMEG
ncbi:MAG: pyroglutamyl-peptidase I [Candidatus Hermodarchaeota archaeon]